MLLSRAAYTALPALPALSALGGCWWSDETPCDIDDLAEVGLVYATVADPNAGTGPNALVRFRPQPKR